MLGFKNRRWGRACNEKEGARTTIEVHRGYAGSRYRRELNFVHRFLFVWFPLAFFFLECRRVINVETHGAYCRMAVARIIILQPTRTMCTPNVDLKVS